MYEKESDSNIQLVINNEQYNIHRNFISKSAFFETLINSNKMSAHEKIEIKDIRGKLVCSKYVADVLNWICVSKDLAIEQLANIMDIKNNRKILLQYYYVVDFLQINGARNKIADMLEETLPRCEFDNFSDPVKVMTNSFPLYLNMEIRELGMDLDYATFARRHNLPFEYNS